MRTWPFRAIGHRTRLALAGAAGAVALYAGQSALVLSTPSAISSPFYLMAPPQLLPPLLILAALATVIASQSIISGAFSVTQQAVQLGYLPRVNIRHTSNESRGQVYAPGVNTLLFIAVIALVLGFRSSSALAAAFGLAVTATMVLTTLMIGFMVFRVWRWNPLWAVPLYGVLFALDLGLFAASSTKFLDGGWLPVTIAVVLVLIFDTWRRGRKLVTAKLATDTMPVDVFAASTAKVHRVPATAIYLTSSREGIPPALLHNLKYNLILHERIFLVTMQTAMTPFVADTERLSCEELGSGLTRVIVRYGFAESPDVPRALKPVMDADPACKWDTAGYFISRQTLIPSKRPGMAIWRDRMFAAMVRNAETPMTFFRLPVHQVMELGSQVEI